MVERKREQGNEGVETGEMRRNISILPRVEKSKKSCKQQQRQRKLRRRRRRKKKQKREGSAQGMRESKKQEIEVSRSRLISQIRMESD